MRYATLHGLLAAATLAASAAATADTTLRMSHFWPAGSAVNQEIFKAWAERVTEDSDGRLKVEIYPSQTLSKADRTYDAAVDGIADVAITLQGYTAGRFPLTEIVQLPGISNSASQGACIVQTLFDEGDIAEEYADTHVLFLFTTGPAYLHTTDTAIRTPADLEGLRIRRPSDVAGEMLSSMGARPLGLPAPDIYTSLQRGVMDGLSFPWEAMKVFRINELTNHHLQVPYYSGAIVATMNQDAYDELPADLKAVIDDNRGMHWARTAGRVFDRLDREGREEALAQGDSLDEIDDPLNDPDWAPPLKEGTQRYLERLDDRGVEGARDVYAKALALRSRCP
ncbi:TRAP transporter substrate-binding protein [Halomonas sp. V046]|uniref:TRAP transporter substrate-binding protein n=1 Tax=Halomonas sp. V046 TaxID=3459611 RepID=UPI004044F41A